MAGLQVTGVGEVGFLAGITDASGDPNAEDHRSYNGDHVKPAGSRTNGFCGATTMRLLRVIAPPRCSGTARPNPARPGSARCGVPCAPYLEHRFARDNHRQRHSHRSEEQRHVRKPVPNRNQSESTKQESQCGSGRSRNTGGHSLGEHFSIIAEATRAAIPNPAHIPPQTIKPAR